MLAFHSSNFRKGLCLRFLSTSIESIQHKQKIQSQFTLQAKPFLEFHSADEQTQIFQDLGKFSKSDRILDSGCGPGIVSRFLSKKVHEVVGLDLTNEMLRIAKEEAVKNAISNCKWVTGDMTNLPFENQSFDGAVTRYTFHHLQAPQEALRELARVTKKGSRIVVVDATPLPSKQAAYNAFEILRDPSHTKALTSSELKSLGDAIPALEMIGTADSVLTLDAEGLVDRAFPDAVTREDLLKLLQDDVVKNNLDFNARYNEKGRLIISFPNTAVVWTVK